LPDQISNKPLIFQQLHWPWRHCILELGLRDSCLQSPRVQDAGKCSWHVQPQPGYLLGWQAMDKGQVVVAADLLQVTYDYGSRFVAAGDAETQ